MVALLRRASRPWCPHVNHDLFPSPHRLRAWELFKIGLLLSSRFPREEGSFFDAWETVVMPHAVRREEA